jgi:hypothetical protein
LRGVAKLASSDEMTITHEFLLVVLVIGATVHAAALTFAIAQLRDSRRMVAEAQRLTKAVGALVIQEAEKTRQLFPR